MVEKVYKKRPKIINYVGNNINGTHEIRRKNALKVQNARRRRRQTE